MEIRVPVFFVALHINNWSTGPILIVLHNNYGSGISKS